jgi:hypothetical protein
MTGAREYDVEADYEIRVWGKLDLRWSRRLADMQVLPQSDGETLIAGPVADQAALYGLLNRMRDLGLVLISVRRMARGRRFSRGGEHIQSGSSRLPREGFG